MKMKRIFALTLILSLMCSLFVTTNAAAADFSVNGRDGWSVASGSGVVGNDGSDTVVKLDGSASVDLGGTHTGALLVTANVKVADGTATIAAMSGDTAVAQATVSAGSEYADTKLYVKAEDNTVGVNKVKIDGNLCVKSIKVEKLTVETPLFSENFEGYDEGAEVTSFTHASYVVNGIDDRKDNLSFKAALDNVADKNISTVTKAGHLYDPTYTGTDTVRYDDSHNIIENTTPETTKNQETWYHDMGENFANYSHIKLRFKYYNAWNSGQKNVPSNVRDSLEVSFAAGTTRATGSDMPNITIQGKTLRLTSGDTGGTPNEYTEYTQVQKWSDAEIDMRIEAGAGATSGRNKVTYTVTIDGVTTPELVHGKANNFRYLHMSINSANGGGFYIDDVEVTAVTELSDNYTEVLFSEDFEDGINGYTKAEGTTKYGHTSSTKTTKVEALNFEAVSDPTAENGSKVGKLEKLKRQSTLDAGIKKADGTLDTSNNINDTDEYLVDEYWTYQLSDEIKNADNLKLSYRYYDEGIAYKYTASTGKLTSATRNYMGVGLCASQSRFNDTDGGVNVYFDGDEESHDLQLNGVKAATNSTKTWNDVTVDLTSITSNQTGKSTVVGSCGAATLNKEINSYNYLVLRIPGNRLGRFYLDDMRITTQKTVTADVIAENKIDNLAKETAYSFNAEGDEVEAYEISGLTYANGSANVTFRKWMDTTDEAVILYVASFDGNGKMLDGALTELTSVDKNTLNNERTLTLEENSDISCVKAFIWGDNLKPLAERYVTAVSPVTVWVASDSVAQNYDNTYYPQGGWGQELQNALFPSAASVENHAIGGRSSRSFIGEERLSTIMTNAKSGDYLLISFAFNDSTSTEEKKALTGKEETDTDGYKYWLKQYIDACNEKGVKPVFVTAPPTYKKEKKPEIATYAAEMKELAAKYSVPVIDVYSEIEALDDATAKGYYMIFNKSEFANDEIFNTQSRYKAVCDLDENGDYRDVIHFRKEGAAAIAQIIADGLRDLPVIGNYVK